MSRVLLCAPACWCANRLAWRRGLACVQTYAVDGVTIVRCEGEINFGNAAAVTARLEGLLVNAAVPSSPRRDGTPSSQQAVSRNRLSPMASNGSPSSSTALNSSSSSSSSLTSTAQSSSSSASMVRFASIRAVVLDGSCVPSVDVSGCQALVEMIEAYKAARVGLHFAAFPQSTFLTIERYMEATGKSAPAPAQSGSQSQSLAVMPSSSSAPSNSPLSTTSACSSGSSAGMLLAVPPQQLYVSPTTGLRNYYSVTAALSAIGAALQSPVSASD
jgi:anti-anti-sigma regulatory factor